MRQGGSTIDRIQLDVAGDPMGEPELLTGFAKNVANAQLRAAAPSLLLATFVSTYRG